MMSPDEFHPVGPEARQEEGASDDTPSRPKYLVEIIGVEAWIEAFEETRAEVSKLKMAGVLSPDDDDPKLLASMRRSMERVYSGQSKAFCKEGEDEDA